MRFPIYTFLFSLMIFSAGSVQAQELDSRDAEALSIIADFADRICKDIPLDSQRESLSLTGEARAELSGLFRRLGDLGITGAAQYLDETRSNVVEENIVDILTTSTRCKEGIWNDLKETVLDNRQGASQKNHAPRPSASEVQSRLLQTLNANCTRHDVPGGSRSGPNRAGVWVTERFRNRGTLKFNCRNQTCQVSDNRHWGALNRVVQRITKFDTREVNVYSGYNENAELSDVHVLVRCKLGECIQVRNADVYRVQSTAFATHSSGCAHALAQLFQASGI